MAGFNEAGGFLPRKLAIAAAHGERGLRMSFNEAGGFLPRKPFPWGLIKAKILGFNEAGGFLPRKRFGDLAGGAAKMALQ